ncbi:MAG: LacI family DNA-binding transcriptional regulator [Kiritimatiellae bacterium]|nr:LacI family DNA-binding transcriptional regulator [Kiritimatiellia bacterium]
MITQTEIAKRLGISQRTVSSALSGANGVGEETCRKILDLAEEEGYRPNRLAAGLRGAKTSSVGIIWSFADPWSNDAIIALDLMHLLQQQKIATYQAQQTDNIDTIVEHINDMLDRQVDAIIIQASPLHLKNKKIVNLLKTTPTIAVCREDVQSFDGDIVVHNRNSAIDEIVAHFAAVGVKKPTFMISLEHESNPPKYKQFLESCEKYGIEEHSNSLSSLERPDVPERIGMRHRVVMRDIIQNRLSDIDAIFCFNDVGALFVLDELCKSGINVPKDIKVVGFNNIQPAEVSNPPLASGDRCAKEVTNTIFEFINKRLNNPKLERQLATVNMKFIWRESAG